MRQLVVVIAAAMAAFAFNAMPADAAGPRQVATLTYTSQAPGTSTGFVGDMRFQNPEDPTLKPHTLKRMVVKSPEGAVIGISYAAVLHDQD